MGRRFTRRWRFVAWGALALTSGALTACGKGCSGLDLEIPVPFASGASRECSGDFECGAGDICRQGICVVEPPCANDSECRFGEICSGGGCGPAECWTDADCFFGLRCCVDACAACCDDLDCPGGRCSGGSCEVIGDRHAGRDFEGCDCAVGDPCDVATGRCLPGRSPIAEGTAVVDALTWVRFDAPEPFEVTRAEITHAQYRQCVEAGYCVPGPRGPDDLPATSVSWADAQRFAAFVGARLPSADQWHRFARRGDARRWPWGNATLDCFHARYLGCAPPETGPFARPRIAAVPVCRLDAGISIDGLCDLVGNAEEWLGDALIDVTGVEYHLVAGAGMATDSTQVHAAMAPARAHSDVFTYGFRLVRAVEAPPPDAAAPADARSPADAAPPTDAIRTNDASPAATDAAPPTTDAAPQPTDAPAP